MAAHQLSMTGQNELDCGHWRRRNHTAAGKFRRLSVT
jgi:hypothetical protein